MFDQTLVPSFLQLKTYVIGVNSNHSSFFCLYCTPLHDALASLDSKLLITLISCSPIRPSPAPLIPSSVMSASHYLQNGERRSMEKRDGACTSDDEVEAACRSFENHLVEIIVEEGKVRELTDVEELLYCWSNLNSPVFAELVSRFYRQLCTDLFSRSTEEYEDNPPSLCDHRTSM